MNIKLFVSSFGNDTAWISNIIKNAVTIEVGAACRTLQEFRGGDHIADNMGDNISKDNPYWGELTGLYWIWKNIKFNDDDIIGFCHYNKMLDISEWGIKKFFKKNSRGWITMKIAPLLMIAEPEHCERMFQAIRKILKNDFPEYYEYWQRCEIYDSDSTIAAFNCASCNLFYTDAQSFREYCDFLFNVLFKLRNMIGDVDWDKNDKRYCALAAERLMTPYIARNCKNFKFVECRVEHSTLFYRLLSRTAHKLNLNIDAKYYDLIRTFFRKRTHYRPAVSSWSKT